MKNNQNQFTLYVNEITTKEFDGISIYPIV